MMANSYSPEKPMALAYRVSSQSGNKFDGKLLDAEAAGLLDRVDAYMAAKGFAQK